MKFRGMIENISEELKREYKEYTGLELDLVTLRLLPYVMDRALNACGLDRGAIRDNEKPIIKALTEKKLCLCHPYNIKVNFCDKKFYDLVSRILYEGYINLYEEETEKKLTKE